MGLQSERSASSAPARWATASRMCARSPASTSCSTTSRRRPHQCKGSPRSTATDAAGVAQAASPRPSAGGAQAHRAGGHARRSSATATSSSRPRPRTRRSSARSSPSCARAEAGRDRRHQHLVDLDHAARRLDRPAGAFIGIHFMNPVPVMELVELIRGIATDDPTFAACQASSSASSARPSRWPRISRPSSSTASCCR